MGLRLSSFPDAGLLDGTELVGLVQNGQTVKAQVNDIAIIAKGPPGSPGEGYPTKIALSDVIALDRDDAYLAEPGAEGKFVFSTADLSAEVTADPTQRNYIAPASDTSGASGAWVRKQDSELIAVDGAGSQLIIYKAPGGQSAALHLKLRQIGNLLDYIPSIQHQDIFDRVSVVDFDTAYLDAIDEMQTYGVCKLRAPAGSLHFAGPLVYPDSSLEIDGEGSNAQPGVGTVFLFGSGVGGVEIKNGVTGKGSNNALRNVCLIGGNVALGTNPGILLHSNMAEIDNVAATGFGLHGLYVFSDDPTVSINANCMSVRRFRSFNNYACGIKTEGANSQLIEFKIIDCSNNGDWGYYENGFLGNGGKSMHFAGNASGDLRIGSISRNNQFFLVYSEEIGGHIAVQIDVGGGEGNIVLIGESGANLVVDNSTNKQNSIYWRDGGSKFNRLSVGSASGISIDLQDLFLALLRGTTVRMQDDPLTANIFLQVVAGALQISHGSGLNTWHLGSAAPAITGSRGGNAALASLLTALQTIGFIVDGTTA